MPEEADVSKYIMIYKGEATDTADMTEEQAGEVMAKWGAWMGTVGSALADVGSPFGNGISVIDDGSTSTPVALSGYSIVEAETLSAAEELSNGHPYLSEGAGNFAIEIFELTPVPFEG
jgi:hypothetical protein